MRKRVKPFEPISKIQFDKRGRIVKKEHYPNSPAEDYQIDRLVAMGYDRLKISGIRFFTACKLLSKGIKK